MGEYRLILWINLGNFLLIAIFVSAGGTFWGPFGAALGVTVGESLNSAIQGRVLLWLLRSSGTSRSRRSIPGAGPRSDETVSLSEAS
jgi:hypothetical protein